MTSMIKAFNKRLAAARQFRESLVTVIEEIGEPDEIGLLHAVWGTERGGSLSSEVTREIRKFPRRDDEPYLWLTTGMFDSSKLSFGLHGLIPPPACAWEKVKTPNDLRPVARRMFDQLVRLQKASEPHTIPDEEPHWPAKDVKPGVR